MADPSRAVPKRRRSNSRGRVLDASSTAAQRPVEQELTDRGRQTRERVLAASRRVFERDGYLDARVADFVKEAGVSHGTFYTYFQSKEEVFHQLAEDLLGTRLDGGSQHERHQGDRPEESVLELVRRANRSYLAGYRERAKLMGIVEQVAMFDPEIRRIRQERSDAFTTRTISNIRLLQKAGLASPDIDPAYASIALTSMVSRFAYVWLVDGPDLGMALEFDEVVETLSVLWVQALGVARDAVAPPRTAR